MIKRVISKDTVWKQFDFHHKVWSKKAEFQGAGTDKPKAEAGFEKKAGKMKSE